MKAPQPSGLMFGIGAYILWGVLPLYFKLLPMVGPVEIVADRILFSLVLMIAILAATGGLKDFGKTLRNRRTMIAMTGSAILIAVNWSVYIWAVANEHILAASLGYFLNPLVNVLLGVLVLKEKLRPVQLAAIFVATIGVAVMAFSAIDTLWISAALAVSFAFYGLIRKTAPVGPRQGLAAETLILAPLAGAYVIWLASQGQATFGQDLRTSTLLALTGIITSVPLLLFATAAKRMPLSMLGLLQYLAPTIQFVIGVLVFDETLTRGQTISFLLIWTGLILFTIDLLRSARAARLAPA